MHSSGKVDFRRAFSDAPEVRATPTGAKSPGDSAGNAGKQSHRETNEIAPGESPSQQVKAAPGMKVGAEQMDRAHGNEGQSKPSTENSGRANEANETNEAHGRQKWHGYAGAHSTLRRWMPALIVVAVICMMGGTIILYQESMAPRPIQTFDVNGMQNLRAEEVIALTGLRKGRAYNDDMVRTAEERLQLHNSIEEARVSGWGARITINIRERPCAAVVRLTHDHAGDVLYEIAPDGLVLAENRFRCQGVPLIQGDFEKSTERFDDPTLRLLLRGLEKMRGVYPELATRISEIHVKPTGGLTLYMVPDRVRVELAGQLGEREILKLYAALSYYEQNDEPARWIDLREEDAVFHP